MPMPSIICRPHRNPRARAGAALLALALLAPLAALAQAVSDPTPLQYRNAA